MSVTAIVNQSMSQIEDKLQSIATLKDKVLKVYNVADLIDGLTGVKYPAAGVVYEGMRSVDTVPRVTDRQGTSAELVLSVYILLRTEAYGPTNQRDIAVEILDDVRGKIIGQRGPSMHVWRFVLEAAAQEKKGTVIWVQRWALPVILTK